MHHQHTDLSISSQIVPISRFLRKIVTTCRFLPPDQHNFSDCRSGFKLIRATFSFLDQGYWILYILSELNKQNHWHFKYAYISKVRKWSYDQCWFNRRYLNVRLKLSAKVDFRKQKQKIIILKAKILLNVSISNLLQHHTSLANSFTWNIIVVMKNYSFMFDGFFLKTPRLQMCHSNHGSASHIRSSSIELFRIELHTIHSFL